MAGRLGLVDDRDALMPEKRSSDEGTRRLALWGACTKGAEAWAEGIVNRIGMG